MRRRREWEGTEITYELVMPGNTTAEGSRAGGCAPPVGTEQGLAFWAGLLSDQAGGRRNVGCACSYRGERMAWQVRMQSLMLLQSSLERKEECARTCHRTCHRAAGVSQACSHPAVVMPVAVPASTHLNGTGCWRCCCRFHQRAAAAEQPRVLLVVLHGCCVACAVARWLVAPLRRSRCCKG